MSSRPNTDPVSLMGDELLRYVRTAAEELAAVLAAGEQATGGWSDAPLTDQIVKFAAQTLLDRLTQTACWGEANRLASSELWRIAGKWLDTGSLQRQARFKPRGYAGDFDLLAKICDDQRCDHPLGRVFDAFFQAQAAPRAVRHRTQIVARAVVEACRQNETNECRVASVGSGPARDIELALTSLTPAERSRLNITLLDLDPAALDYAAERLRPLLNCSLHAPREEPPHAQREATPDSRNVSGDPNTSDFGSISNATEGVPYSEHLFCARENLFRLARNARTSALLHGAHIITCVGFFDYLADADAAALLAAFWRELAPGGQLLVFNFTPANPSRAYMEWIGNWYLRYRSLNELADLAQQAGLPTASFHVDAEELGVDAFLSARRD